MKAWRRRRKKDHDFSVTAFRVVQEVAGEIESRKKKAFDAKAPGHNGGLNGGKARAAKLTPERRSETARRAAQAKWAKQPHV